jgi:hypothetical protein
VDEKVWVKVRIDPWLVAVAVAMMAVIVFAVVPLVLDPGVLTGVRIAVGAMALVTIGLTFGFTVPLRYAFEDGGVFVRAGLVRMRLAYRDIARAEKVVSPLSSAAWSLVKVRLVLAQGGLIEISPQDRDAFLAELARRAPHLQPTPKGLADPKVRSKTT